VSSEEVPEGFPRMTARQVDHDAADPLAHPATDLDETQTERAELESGETCLHEPAPQRIQQPVRGGMQEQPELIGPEAEATEPIGKAAVFQILDPLLGGAALHVPVVEVQRWIGTRRDHEAGVGAFGQDFRLVDDPARMRPGVGGIRGLAGQAHLLAGLLVLPLGLRQQRRRQGLQARIGGQADGIGNAFLLAPGGEGRHRKAAIGPQLDGDPRPAVPEQADDALEHGDHPPARVHGPGTQDGRDELVGVPIEDKQRMVHVLPVVAMVGRTFLLAVSGVIGAVHVEQNVYRRSAGLVLTDLLPLLQIDAAERDGELIASACGHGILQAREGRLAGQVPSTLRSAAADPLEQGIAAQGGGIVLVVVAAGDLEDPLPHQGLHRMLDWVSPPVTNLAGQGGTQTQDGIRLSDPGQATIRGQATGVKGNVLWPGGKHGRRALPCAKLGHEVSPGTLEWE
jgi:hypothetical protein